MNECICVPNLIYNDRQLDHTEKLSLHRFLQAIIYILLLGEFGEGNGTLRSVLAWRIPWTEEPGRWQSMGSLAKSQTRLSDFIFTFHFHALEKEMATHSSVLAWKISGMGEPGGLPSMGLHRVGQD